MDNETNQSTALYAEALEAYIAARKRLIAATIAYDHERHTARTALYALKESGARKMTEEQIRSEAVVRCQSVYAEYTTALGECEIASERLEFAKHINK